jgi:putative hydrolase of the HAD superfamily
MIQAVIFDLGGVLVDNPAPGMISHYAAHFSVSPDAFIQAFTPYAADWQKGTLIEQELWEHIASALHGTTPTEESLWLEGFLSTYQEKQEMFALIKRLKEHNFTVALLSNTEGPVMNYIKQKAWTDVDCFMYSCEVGMMKPEHDIYERTLKNLGLIAQDVVFIDDKEENIVAAREVGMDGIVFNSPQQVISELRRMGVMV